VHYADDQETFIAMLMRRLTPEGLLVLEMGVAPGEDDAFVAVERRLGEHATDARLFPTWKKAHSLLADYAFKYMGESVRQAGDPLPRHVFHVQRRKPLAVLLMDGHYSGKTYAAGKMMHPSVKTVAGEQVYHDIMDGRIAATDALKKRIRYVDGTRHMMPPAITSDICAAGLLPDLADVFIAMADNGDFVCEHYIPGPYRERLCELMDDAGFFVVICTMFNSVKASPPWVKIRPPYSEYEAYAAYLEDKFAGAGAR
jgi:hypothetical protein